MALLQHRLSKILSVFSVLAFVICLLRASVLIAKHATVLTVSRSSAAIKTSSDVDPILLEGNTSTRTSSSSPSFNPVYSVGASEGQTQPPAISRIEIFGERRSGTNWLQNMIALNFGREMLAIHLHSTRAGKITRGPHGWKHGPVSAEFLANSVARADPQLATADTLFLVVVKNPYAWMLSMQRSPHEALFHVGLALPLFIRKPWLSFQNQWTLLARLGLGNPVLEEDLDPMGWPYSNVCRLRVGKLRAHLSLLRNAPHAVLIRYEDLLSDAEAVLRYLSTLLQLPFRQKDFVPLYETCEASSYRTGRCQGQSKHFKPRQDWYRVEQWLDHFSLEDLRFLAQELDPELELSLGYQLVDPDSEVIDPSGSSGSSSATHRFVSAKNRSGTLLGSVNQVITPCWSVVSAKMDDIVSKKIVCT
eukprot:gb/GEZN01007469.1/.p1 GENE.gb/GEZN01007469.1/~~gb/GEZN01007469.1/.p1  ORF type:complete len:419 (-),score=54.03 gb/GEZN01007469.1/:142-1398(-)